MQEHFNKSTRNYYFKQPAHQLALRFCSDIIFMKVVLFSPRDGMRDRASWLNTVSQDVLAPLALLFSSASLLSFDIWKVLVRPFFS